MGLTRQDTDQAAVLLAGYHTAFIGTAALLDVVTPAIVISVHNKPTD